MIRKQFGQCVRPVFLAARQNHFSHGIYPIAFKKHMLGAAKPYAFCAKSDCVCHLLGRISVRAHVEFAKLIHPIHQLRVLLVRRAFLSIERTIDQNLHNL